MNAAGRGCSSLTPIRSSSLARIDIYQDPDPLPDVVPLQPVPGHAICYTVAGSWEIRYGKTWQRLNPGDVNVVGLVRGSDEYARSQPQASVFLQLLAGAVDADAGPFFSRPIVHLDLARHILHAAAAADDDEFDSCIFELFDAVSQRSRTARERTSANRIRIERVKRFIESHFLESLSLSEVAASAHIGPFTCLRQFKAATGETPNEYIIRLRLRMAKQLLSDPGVSISQVAEKSGFKTHPHFTRTFQMHTGMSPTLYRQQAGD
jgi:AraC-like DNA-binding protein